MLREERSSLRFRGRDRRTDSRGGEGFRISKLKGKAPGELAWAHLQKLLSYHRFF